MNNKSPLKWTGGKSWLAPKLAELYEPYREKLIWCEPFVGGGSGFIQLQPEQSFLNDTNKDLVAFWNNVKSGQLCPFTWKNDEIFYYQMREKFNQSKDPMERGWLFYYLNKTGFNGLCRYNSKGLYNVPFGKYKTINYCYNFSDTYNIPAFQMFNEDFSGFIKRFINEEVFIYCDPPYDNTFTDYNAGGFRWADHVELVSRLSKFDTPVVISNLATPSVLDLYKSYGYETEIIEKRHMISGKKEGRKVVEEVLATKNL